MCGKAKSLQLESKIKLGYFGGYLQIKDLKYSTVDYDDYLGSISRESMYKELSKYSKDTIINMILDFVDTAEEV